MEYDTIGKSTIRVSRLCFGGWQASGWSSSSDSGFKRALEHALDHGVNFIDTAEAYGNGHSEQLIGEVIKHRPREHIVIATKFSHTRSEPKLIRESLYASLKRLQTDYVDLYQQHWPPRRPPLSVSLEALEQLKTEGKIRAIGVSNWMEPEWSEIDNPGRIDSLQPCYSLLWRSIEKSVLPMCIAHSISVLPYSPLCQGLLAGRFLDKSTVPTDFRSKNRMLSAAVRGDVDSFLQHLAVVARHYNKPISAVALRWLLDKPGVTALIVGASCIEQVDENLLALSWKLEPEHHKHLSEMSQHICAQLGPHDTLWNWHPRGKP